MQSDTDNPNIELIQSCLELTSTQTINPISFSPENIVNNLKSHDIVTAYWQAKDIVLRVGFKEEIRWQASVNLENITESDFLREHAWVTLSAGMHERVIRRLFDAISSSFYDWESAMIVIENESRCRKLALMHFNNVKKVEAIILTAHRIFSDGFDSLKQALYINPLELLQSLPYIGPVTCYHLAKNIGLPVAKPDRHLTRLANSAGYTNVQSFCKDISVKTGDSIPVVDIVLWRFASTTDGYLNVFRSAAMDINFGL